MRYLSIDLETTGLNHNYCQIIQVAAVYDDTSKPLEDAPTFNALVRHDIYEGEPYAIALNQDIFAALAKLPDSEQLPSIEHHGRRVDCLRDYQLSEAFQNWLDIHADKPVLLAGKNVAGFDLNFLNRLEVLSRVPVHHRVLDPGNLYLRPTDKYPPSTDECLRRAGLDRTVSHDAIEDAYDVCHLIRVWEQKYEKSSN